MDRSPASTAGSQSSHATSAVSSGTDAAGASASASSGGQAIVSAEERERGPPASSITSRISAMKAEQQAQVVARRALAREIKNEERKKRRLRDKAQKLSDSELLQVLRLREDTRALSAARAAAASSQAAEEAGTSGDQTEAAGASRPAASREASPAKERREEE